MIVEFDNTPTIYCDVDGTLLFWPGEDPGCPPMDADDPLLGQAPVINQPLVDALKAWHAKGNVLVVWSRAGGAHARKAAEMCGLSPDACLPKPRIAFDDRPRSIEANDRHGFIVLAPNEGFRLPA